MENKPESRNLEAPESGKDPEEGQIRIFTPERKHLQFSRKLFKMVLAGVLVGVALIFLTLYMKYRIDTRINESYDALTLSGNNFTEFERGIYSREKFRKMYDNFATNMVGVAASREAFLTNDYDVLTTGILYDTSGNILAPGRILRGRTTAFIRTFRDGQELLLEGFILGRDELSGVVLISAPSLARSSSPSLVEDSPTNLAESMIHIATPNGDPAQGNINMPILNSSVILYTMNTGNQEYKIPAFSLSNTANTQNDGGAVLNLDGELAGMASLELTRELKLSPYVTVLPTSELLAIADRIKKGEFPVNLSFGLSGNMITNDSFEGTGFYVLEVVPGSTADRGGLNPTDIILSINGEPLDQARTIDSYLAGRRVGDEMTVKVIQGSTTNTLKIRIY